VYSWELKTVKCVPLSRGARKSVSARDGIVVDRVHNGPDIREFWVCDLRV
jgi:hypothetical protein